MKEKLFIHIPKCAGIEIRKILRCEAKEHTPFLIDGLLDLSKLNVESYPNWKNYYSFSFVRNPYDRVISAYFYLLNGGMKNKLDLGYWELIKEYGSLDNCINDLSNLKLKVVHFVEQNKFICNGHTILVDFVGKVENLQNDLYKVSPTTEFVQRFANKTEHEPVILTDGQKEIIYEQYKDDFLIFNYER